MKGRRESLPNLYWQNEAGEFVPADALVDDFVSGFESETLDRAVEYIQEDRRHGMVLWELVRAHADQLGVKEIYKQVDGYIRHMEANDSSEQILAELQAIKNKDE